MATDDQLNLQPADAADEPLNLQNPDGSQPDAKIIHGRKEDWLDRMIRAAGGVGVGTPAYPDFKNLKIGSSGQKFVDPSQDPDYEARRRLAFGTLAGQGALTGGLATGAPPLAALLGGAFAGGSAKTPGDVAGSTASSFIPAPNFGSRGINTILGLLRGYGMAKTADTARAAGNQEPLPSWLQPDLGSAAGAVLGAAGGLGTGKPKIDPKDAWVEEGKPLASQVVTAKDQQIAAKSALDAAKEAKEKSKVSIGQLLRERDNATDALNSEKSATQKQLQDALAAAQDKLKNSKIVGSEEFLNNEVARAQQDLADLQNKDFTQTDAGKRLAQAEANLAPGSQDYTKARLGLIMAQKAHSDAQNKFNQAKNAVSEWQNRKPEGMDTDKFDQFFKAVLKHGSMSIAGGIFGGLEGHNWQSALLGAGAGAGASWLNNTPQGRQVLQSAPQAIPGLSNLQSNLHLGQ